MLHCDQGFCQSQLILRTFALAHLHPDMDILPDHNDTLENLPTGGLILALQAVHTIFSVNKSLLMCYQVGHVLQMWQTGSFVEDKSSTGHFSADHYSDKSERMSVGKGQFKTIL